MQLSYEINRDLSEVAIGNLNSELIPDLLREQRNSVAKLYREDRGLSEIAIGDLNIELISDISLGATQLSCEIISGRSGSVFNVTYSYWHHTFTLSLIYLE